jgi:polysaccharide export outer membrane protein
VGSKPELRTFPLHKAVGAQMCSGVRFLIMLRVLLLGGCLPNERPDVAYAREIRVYRLGPGDQVRLIVFDQPSLSNIYSIDAGGHVSIPLVGAVKA